MCGTKFRIQDSNSCRLQSTILPETMENLREVDVICQHSADGTIIPLRVRITDEDGLRQAFTIKGYKDLSHHGTRTMPDGIYVTDKTLIFQCKICVIDRERIIMLYYDPSQTIWKMTG